MSSSGADTSRPLPVFANIEVQDRDLPDGVLLEHLKAFQALYREHCEVGPPPCPLGPPVLTQKLSVISSQAVLDVMVNLQFTLVETLWKSFWRFSEAESLSL